MVEEFNKEIRNVTRVEVIDENGRSYVSRYKHNQVEISIQDDGRTLKIFIARERENG